MTCQSVAADIAAAVKTTSIASSDILAVVSNATLYGITFSNFQAALGVTGQIKPVGSASAVQIINKPSTGLNYIRSLLPTQGITAIVDSYGNINIKTNIANAGTSSDGKQLIIDPTAAQIKFKRLKASSGISLLETTNGIEISATELALTSKTVIIGAMSDFPAAVGGTITVEEDTDYVVTNDLTTSDRFITISGSPCVMRSSDRSIVSLVYTGTAAMFTSVNPALTIKDISITCATGTFVDTTGSSTGTIRLSDISIPNVKNLGAIDSVRAITVNNMSTTAITGDGFVFSGTGISANLNGMLFSAVSAGVDLYKLGTATFKKLRIDNIAVNASESGSVFLSGAAASANIEGGAVANVTSVNINGSMTSLTNIATTDNQFDFKNSNTIPDTRPDAFGVFLTPTTTTLAAATPALINGTWTSVRTSQMTFSAAGRATYTGENGGTFPIFATVTAQPVSSTNKVINFYFAKNGTIVANTKVKATISNLVAEQHTVIWQDALVKGDYYELWVESVDGTNVQIDNAKLAVN
jgi:hypothetical protein